MFEAIRVLSQMVLEGFKTINSYLVSYVFAPPLEQAYCPECGGTELFDGHGSCQICQPM